MKTLELQKPYLLVVVGLPGAGKTFFAKQFSDMFKTPYVDYAHYHELIKDQELGDIVATELIGQLAVTKQTIVVEGRGESKHDRVVLMKLGQSIGYETLFIWVQTEPQTAYKRAQQSSNYSSGEYEAKVQSFALLDRTEPYVVISGKFTFASQARMILKKIVIPRPATAVQAPASRNATQPPRQAIPRPPSSQRPSGRINIG